MKSFLQILFIKVRIFVFLLVAKYPQNGTIKAILENCVFVNPWKDFLYAVKTPHKLLFLLKEYSQKIHDPPLLAEAYYEMNNPLVTPKNIFGPRKILTNPRFSIGSQK